MVSVSTNYNLVWKYLDDDKYQFTRCGKCINILRNKEVKRVLVGYTEGFCLNGKFKSLSQIRNKLIKIENTNCPF